jgi:diguanylate cyclase (GGDEF)-like protein/PAS domain S-box-containing protein
MDYAPDGILAVDNHGRIFLVNPALCALTGYAAHELLGQPLEVLLPPDIRGRHGAHLAAYFSQPQVRAMGLVNGLALWRRDGTPVRVDISLGNAQRQGAPCALAFIRDISELCDLRQRMDFQATHDGLTGLHNRWVFADQLSQAISHGQRTGAMLAVLLIDLDDFKAINDGHGHGAGDRVLQEVARRLRSVLRGGDSLARLGGDEFAVLLRDLRDPVDAQVVAQKIVQTLGEPYRIDHYVVYPGASVGVVFAPQDANDAETLMRFADLAMYQAKDNGRATYATYAASMSYLLEEKILIHERLKHALAHNQLELHYQPQVQLPTGQVVALEALLRWNDAELGPVSPARFVPVAESTGLMVQLGDWVLETACRQLAEWRLQGLHPRVAINVSAQQFRQAGLVERLQFLLRRWGIDPRQVEVEVTESVAMIDPAQAADVLRGLTAVGVSVALDDFGMGHSSLAYLRQLPVSRLKIDHTFMREVCDSDNCAALAKAIMGLAHALDMSVVAEGVETQAQLDFLCLHGCGAYQGWLFSKAVPATEVAALMALSAPVGAACRGVALRA